MIYRRTLTPLQHRKRAAMLQLDAASNTLNGNPVDAVINNKRAELHRRLAKDGVVDVKDFTLVLKGCVVRITP